MHPTRTLKSVVRRTAVTCVVVVTALAGTGGTAQADPISDLLTQAQSILDLAIPGKPLNVVITTATADAPTITTTKARSTANALQIITSALKRRSTIGVDMVQPVRIAATNDHYRSAQWGLTMFGAEKLWKKSKGKSVVVAVVDTGVSKHSDLKWRVRAGRDFISPGTSASDQNGHGTHVAGVIAANANNRIGIAGLAYQAKILPVRVLDENGIGDNAGVAKGIIWAAQHGAHVINLSLGATQGDSAIQAAVAYAQSRNVVVVAAAGNEGCAFLFGSPTAYPASYPGVLGVGAISSDRNVASYSSCGRWVDVVAPGSGIVSTTISSPNADLGCRQRVKYCTLSGTSMATPYASAAAALEISRLGRRFKQASIVSRLQSTATDLGSAGRDNSYGYGLINPSRLLSGR